MGGKLGHGRPPTRSLPPVPGRLYTLLVEGLRWKSQDVTERPAQLGEGASTWSSAMSFVICEIDVTFAFSENDTGVASPCGVTHRYSPVVVQVMHEMSPAIAAVGWAGSASHLRFRDGRLWVGARPSRTC